MGKLGVQILLDSLPTFSWPGVLYRPVSCILSPIWAVPEAWDTEMAPALRQLTLALQKQAMNKGRSM